MTWRSLCVVALLVLASVVPVGAQESAIQEAEELNQQVIQLYGQGRYNEAIPPAARALAIREQALGPTHSATGQSLNNLAELYRLTGAYTKAEPLYERALANHEQALGLMHPATAQLVNNLAELYRTMGAYTKAKSLHERALAIREQALGLTHPATVQSLNNLAQLYQATGAYEEAERLYQRALAIKELGLLALGQEGAIRKSQELSQQVENLYEKNQYRKAIPLAVQALAIREQTLGPTHPGTAASLNNLAALYSATGAFDKAAPLVQRALAIREKTAGPTHPATAASLHNLAHVYYGTGAYNKAGPLYQRALTIREQALGPTHPATGQSLHNLALLYHATEAYDKAEALYQRALAIREQKAGPTHLDTAASLHNLAQLYYDTGAYTKAEPLYQRALTIRELTLGPTHLDTAVSLYNLGQLYHATGAYTKAEPLLQRALAINEQALGPEHLTTVRSLNGLGGLYHSTGAYEKAELLFQRAVEITEQALGPEHLATAESLNYLAELYRITGAYEKAEPRLQRALAITEQALGLTHPFTAEVLNNLGVLYSFLGAYEKAEPLLQRALAIREKALRPTHPATFKSRNDLALLYYTTGAIWKAETHWQRALEIQEKALGPEHRRNTASTLHNLGLLYHTTGAYTKAEPLLQRALTIREQALGPTHPATATSLNNLAELHWATGDPPTALTLFERAQTIQEKNTAEFLLFGSESRKQAYLQQLRGVTFAKISLSLTESGGQAAALGLTSVLQAKGRVLDAMSDSLARLRQSVRPEDRKLLEQFIDVVQQRSTFSYQGPGKLPPEVYRARLSELAATQEQLETELATRSAEFRQQITPITLATVQSELSGDAVLLEWFRYEPDPKGKYEPPTRGKPRYVAYVLKRAGEPAVVDMGEAESIELLVQDFRKALSDPQNLYVKEEAKGLSERLIKPLRQHLGNTEHLLISADGALNLVPFGALVDDSGHYFANKREITYLTSGRDLLRFGTTPVARDDAVVVADPDYGPFATSVPQADTAMQTEGSVDLERGRLRFRPLLGTAEEAKALTPLMKVTDTHLLTQAKATEAKLKQLHGPRILHIATHGFFLSDKELAASMLKPGSFSQDPRPLPLGENPLLRSGLALAGANQRRSGEKDDGILTAAEVAQMDLRGTRLVVLSACETGVGEVQNGEGVYGLRRALVLAGAQTQVASLWKVADDATKDLMVDYYQRLLKGEGRSAALRQAQLSMIESQDRSHPYYWAGFVPIGDWRPLAQEK